MIDLQHRAEEVVAMLHHAAADRQHGLERHADLALPEGAHGVEPVGVEPDIDARLCEVHGLLFQTQTRLSSPASVA
ncbi:MAG: hypothetical protein WDN08_20895 [Rhizomicrobium sp.]